MTLPNLGRRGEGWVIAQSAVGVAIVLAGILGDGWPASLRTLFAIAGVVVALAGIVLFIAGIRALGTSLTPYPAPTEASTFKGTGIYRYVRHPIYGGVLVMALGWSLIVSPLALAASVILVVLLELKSRHEESLLLARYPEYEAYRRRVPWRFVPKIH